MCSLDMTFVPLKCKNGHDYLTECFFLRWPMAIALTAMQYGKLTSDFFALFKNILPVKIENNSNYLFKRNKLLPH